MTDYVLALPVSIDRDREERGDVDEALTGYLKMFARIKGLEIVGPVLVMRVDGNESQSLYMVEAFGEPSTIPNPFL